MIEILVGNSYSQIKGLTQETFRSLKKVLSYESNPAEAFYGGGFRRSTYLIDAKGSFPTGLLHLVKAHLSKIKKVFKVTDSRVVPQKLVSFQIKLPYELYDDQHAALYEADAKGRGIISMPTGTGKSIVIASLIGNFRLRTLVIVPNLELKTQLETDLKTYFGSLNNIRVENIDSTALKTAKDYDMLIIDEAHHVAARTYQRLNKTAWTGIYHRFFLTATPFRNRDEERLLFEAIAGEVIFRLTYKQAIKRGYIVPVEAYYYDCPEIPNDYFTWPEVYSNLVVNNAMRNEMIAILATRLNACGVSTLCLVKEIKHGEALAKLTGLHFANGQDEETRPLVSQFKTGALNALIGTTGIMGEGVDTKPAEYILISGLGKAKSAFMQQVGRGVRTYPGKESCKIILFRDKSHKFPLKHFREQCKILLDEYGVKPVKLEL